MRPAVFVDTSAWVGFFAPRDQHHSAAVDLLDRLGDEGRVLVTSDFILDETVTRLRVQGSWRMAAEAWDVIEGDLGHRVIQVGVDDRRKAREWFRKLSGIPLSLTDCTSFALMNRLGIEDAATFDADFRKAGFRLLPG